MQFDGLKHVNLKVKDIEKSTKFYAEGFGMEVVATAYEGKIVGLTTPNVGDMLVLTEGEPEGNLEFSGPSREGDGGGVDHIGFMLRDAADLDQAVEHLVSLGATFECTLGESYGRRTAFVRDPDGYVVQIDPGGYQYQTN